MNRIDYSCLNLDTTNGRPRVLLVGKQQCPDLIRHLFPKTPHQRKLSSLVESFGFGQEPEFYDYWIPGNDRQIGFARDLFIVDPKVKGETYQFDLVVLHLDNWKNYLDKKSLGFCPDPYNLMTWCLDRLVPGAPLVMTGTDTYFREIVSSMAYRLSNVHCMGRGQASAGRDSGR